MIELIWFYSLVGSLPTIAHSPLNSSLCNIISHSNFYFNLPILNPLFQHFLLCMYSNYIGIYDNHLRSSTHSNRQNWNAHILPLHSSDLCIDCYHHWTSWSRPGTHFTCVGRRRTFHYIHLIFCRNTLSTLIWNSWKRKTLTVIFGWLEKPLRRVICL